MAPPTDTSSIASTTRSSSSWLGTTTYNLPIVNRLSLNKKRRFPFTQKEHNDIESSSSSSAKRPNLTAAEKDHNMNGHHKILGDSSSSRFKSSSGGSSGMNSNSGSSASTNQPPPIASLCNLGNTCFLNSVLYTLRFTPGFLHNLHHLVYDLGIRNSSNGKKQPFHQQQQQSSQKNGIADADTELVHDVIDQLHDLFKTLSTVDDHPEGHMSSTHREPIPPSTFLNAVGKLNPMFEGNQQQDAHELLVTLLNMLQDIKIPANTNNTTAIGEEASSSNEALNGQISNNGQDKKKGGKKFLLSSSSNHVNGVVEQPPPSLKPIKLDSLLPNFVRENFVGKSVMRTRCLECEMSTYRSETFTNIDIPLSFDDADVCPTAAAADQDQQSSTLSIKDLFLKQIMASETLRENNKYWCAECSRLNEAQRSVEYELLPKVMVLQLKRFTAAANKTAYMSKINDYLPTPFTMNCFCTQCMPPSMQPKHHYRLFAVIMHLGATLASGHYIAYVRAAGDLTWDYQQCQRSTSGNNSVERNKNKKGIMKYFSRSSASSATDAVKCSNGHSSNGSINSSSSSSLVSSESSGGCRSANCCGMPRVLGQLNVGENSNSMLPHQRSSLDSVDSQETPNSSSSSSEHDDVWLECDDESISVITRRQFEDELSSKQSATTPYLLFYQRV